LKVTGCHAFASVTWASPSSIPDCPNGREGEIFYEMKRGRLFSRLDGQQDTRVVVNLTEFSIRGFLQCDFFPAISPFVLPPDIFRAFSQAQSDTLSRPLGWTMFELWLRHLDHLGETRPSIVQRKPSSWATQPVPLRTPQKSTLCLQGWSLDQTESRVRSARPFVTGNH